jgi:AraC family transcriptional regulator
MEPRSDQSRNDQLLTIGAELRVPAATVQLVRYHLPEPIDRTLWLQSAYRFDLCRTPRPHNTRACFRDRWGPHRFERIGNVFVVPPGEPLHARSDCGRQTSIVCWLYPEPLRAWFDGDLEWNPRRLEASLDVRNANIRSLLLRVAEETRHPGFASRMLVELIAAQMAIELARTSTAIPEGPVTGGLAPWRLRQIDERLREVREAPTLPELAGLCRLSVRQLTRGFRASRGCSIGEYVAASRVDHAKRLLATDQAVKAIAHSLGFSSPSAFAFAFRRATGEAPREFRQRVSRGDRS